MNWIRKIDGTIILSFVLLYIVSLTVMFLEGMSSVFLLFMIYFTFKLVWVVYVNVKLSDEE